MNKFVKIAAVAAVAMASTPAFAQAVGPTGGQPEAKARIIRPLTLTASGELNFGTIVIDGLSGSATATVGANGVRSCGAGLVCAPGDVDVAAPAFNVRGTQGQTVNILLTDTQLSGTNGGTLNLTLTSDQANNQLVLANSGLPGNDFNVGGSIVISDTTIEGVYTGNVNVQVEYD